MRERGGGVKSVTTQNCLEACDCVVIQTADGTGTEIPLCLRCCWQSALFYIIYFTCSIFTVPSRHSSTLALRTQVDVNPENWSHNLCFAFLHVSTNTEPVVLYIQSICRSFGRVCPPREPCLTVWRGFGNNFTPDCESTLSAFAMPSSHIYRSVAVSCRSKCSHTILNGLQQGCSTWIWPLPRDVFPLFQYPPQDQYSILPLAWKKKADRSMLKLTYCMLSLCRAQLIHILADHQTQMSLWRRSGRCRPRSRARAQARAKDRDRAARRGSSRPPFNWREPR